MKTSPRAALIRYSSIFAALGLLAACTNEGQTYVKSHPELNPVQRKMIITGKIPNGTAVAGLTRDQIRLAMGVDPYTIDRQGDEDVWVFTHKKAVASDPAFAETAASGALDKEHGYSETDTEQKTPRIDVDVKTSVYFQGNIATHAQTVEEKSQ
jgi:outer membrane protein assembly factor BamE (lipoprotein component of BamABCDE complex)